MFPENINLFRIFETIKSDLTQNKSYYRSQAKRFLSGAVGYCCIELLWRQRTHWSMALSGGVCFCSLCSIVKKLDKIFLKAGAGAVLISFCELVCGCIVNHLLDLKVWTYEKKPFNLLGQICPEYSFYWLVLTLALLPVIELEGLK